MSLSRWQSLSLFALLATLVLASLPGSSSGEDNADRLDRGERIPGQYIVVLKDSVTDVEAAESDILGRGGERLDSYRSALRGFAARFSDEELAAVASDPRVAFVSEDRVVSTMEGRPLREGTFGTARERTDRRMDPPPPPSPAPSPTPPPPPPVSEQAVASSVQSLPTGVDRIDAESLLNTGANVNVAVIDTGILASHPDLSGKIVGGKNCTRASGGYTDQNGHGTHVAGTIAANNNTQGVVGVAPGAKLWSVRVLDRNGNGTWSSVICGLDYVTSKAPSKGGPIRVANLSLGGGGFSDNNCGNSNNDALHKAICRARDAGVTIVVAAGNSGVNAANAVPAAYDDAVITVSALADTDGKPGGAGAATSYGADDTFASFSNWGSAVDIGAPGVWIKSTWLKNGYATISGTSMASPHVAGAAALYIFKNPAATWTTVRDALVANGEALGAGHTDPSGNHPEKVLNASSL